MGALTEPIRKEHAELREHVEHIRLAAREIPDLSPEERVELRARVLDFLSDTLVPHAKVEERVLYPEVARLLESPEATAPMVYDHLAIRTRIADLADADSNDTARLQELLYGLYALIKVHLSKEEELYLPLLDTLAGPAARPLLELIRKH